jgi:prepilin-type N-terminal cleavage/methylation domain-containing protein
VRKPTRAFTLIELLVVIAIIAVLAAILMPALQGALRKGRQTVCLNNLHQIGIGFELYAGDYNSYWPNYHEYLATFERDPTASTCPSIGPLYLNGLGVTFCPEQVLQDNILWKHSQSIIASGVGNESYTSYGVNVYMCGFGGAELLYTGAGCVCSNCHLRQFDVPTPAATAYLMDAARFDNLLTAADPSQLLPFYQNSTGRVESFNVSLGAPPSYGAGVIYSLHVRHPNNTCNTLMMDEHAESDAAASFGAGTTRGAPGTIWDNL